MITCTSIGRMGRFGNACFQISGIIGIAKKNNQPYSFPEFITHDNAIFGDTPDNIEQHLVNELPRLPEFLTFQKIPYHWGYKDFNLPVGNYDIDGHFQSEKYFKHCMPLIRETFRFKDEPPQNGYVALHFRAGDYTEGNDGHHPRCTREYYEEAMKLFPGKEFILFSDDHQSWYTMMGESASKCGTFRYGTHYLEDFKLMKNCHSFITANSSFSLFAAILGEHPEKKIVCPRRWFGSSMPPEFGTEDIYPENAIIL